MLRKKKEKNKQKKIEKQSYQNFFPITKILILIRLYILYSLR